MYSLELYWHHNVEIEAVNTRMLRRVQYITLIAPPQINSQSLPDDPRTRIVYVWKWCSGMWRWCSGVWRRVEVL